MSRTVTWVSRGSHVVQVVRRIDVAVREVKWSATGELVALLSESSFYILAFDVNVRFFHPKPVHSNESPCAKLSAWVAKHVQSNLVI